MPVMNFDLEDGKKPVSFSLNGEDCQRMVDFMKECQDAKNQAEEDAAVIDKLAKLLARIAIIIKGEELPLKLHSYHDLPDEVEKIIQQRDEIFDAATLERRYWDIFHGEDGCGGNPKEANEWLRSKGMEGVISPQDFFVIALDKAIANVESDPTAKQAGIRREAMNMIVNFTCSALEKAGFEHIDNPADAIEVLATQRDESLAALKLALEYWQHRQQRYKNRHPAWVQAAQEVIAKTESTHG
jgi:hypothetical protein